MPKLPTDDDAAKTIFKRHFAQQGYDAELLPDLQLMREQYPDAWDQARYEYNCGA
jgi:hypothetical protein